MTNFSTQGLQMTCPHGLETESEIISKRFNCSQCHGDLRIALEALLRALLQLGQDLCGSPC